jgi:hypothetical protein
MAESDPLVLHLAEADWVYRLIRSPRKNLESELMRIVAQPTAIQPCGSPRRAKLVLHGTEHWRMLARAIVTESDAGSGHDGSAHRHRVAAWRHLDMIQAVVARQGRTPLPCAAGR